jgi:hypothetical protein
MKCVDRIPSHNKGKKCYHEKKVYYKKWKSDKGRSEEADGKKGLWKGVGRGGRAFLAPSLLFVPYFCSLYLFFFFCTFLMGSSLISATSLACNGILK